MLTPALYPVLFSGSIDPDVVAWRSAVVANGGSVSGGAVAAVNRFVRGCKSDGVWDLLLDVGLFAGVDNLSAALVKLKTPSGVSRTLTNNNFVSADYTATGSAAGLVGNGSSKWLQTGFAQTAFPSATNHHIGAYEVVAAASGNFAQFMGSETSNEVNTIALGNYGAITTKAFRTQASTNVLSATNQAAGHFIGVRTADQFLYRNGSQVASRSPAGSSSAMISTEIGIFRNNGNSGSTTSARLSLYHMGASMTAAQVAAFSARVNTLMAAFGCNTY